jgi:tetratricopeptide (TPR) repeat protein
MGVVTASSSSDFARLGDHALGAGRRDEAIDHYRAALAIDPTMATIWYNIGWALRSARQFEGALHAYGEALKHGIRDPEEARLNRAAILADHLYQPDAAIDELNAALADAPAFVPALLNLGTLYEDSGRAAPARQAYRRALAYAPANGRALARLAMIDLAAGHISKALGALAGGLRIANAPADRAEVLYATATALDADGQYDAAFETLSTANTLAKVGARNRYDPQAHERLITRLIETFRAPRSFAVAQIEQVLQPIFIVGMFRSGSTLVEQLLARHSTIIAGGELEFIPALVQSQLAGYPEAITQLDQAAINATRSAYLTELARVAPVGRVTDKRCDNILHIGLIKTLFPEAPIIHTVRTPLDTLISVLFLHFGEGISYGHDQRDAAHYYIQYRRLLDHWRSLYGAQIFDVDYDNVVVDPRVEIEPTLKSFGLTWEPEAGRADQERSVRTASSWQVRKALHRQSSGRWHQYARHLEPAQNMLADAGLL